MEAADSPARAAVAAAAAATAELVPKTRAVRAQPVSSEMATTRPEVDCRVEGAVEVVPAAARACAFHRAGACPAPAAQACAAWVSPAVLPWEAWAPVVSVAPEAPELEPGESVPQAAVESATEAMVREPAQSPARRVSAPQPEQPGFQ